MTSAMESHVIQILEGLGESPTREGLKDTPERVVKSWKEMTSGYNSAARDTVGRAIFNEPDLAHTESSGITCVKDIDFASISNKNLLPFYGRCHIAYSPRGGMVMGLSKFARLVQVYAKRIQSQETLTQTLVDTVMKEAAPYGVAVVIEAQHVSFLAPRQEPFFTFSCDGCFKNGGERQEELQAVMLVNNIPAGSLPGPFKEDVNHQNTLDWKEGSGESAAVIEAGLRLLLHKLGAVDKIEGIDSGLRAYAQELLCATSGCSEDIPDIITGIDCHLNVSPISNSSGDPNLGLGVEVLNSCGHKTNENNGLLVNTYFPDDMEEADCCVQDIRWMCHFRKSKSLGHGFLGVKENCIEFQSTCEHHLLPFRGRVYIGYIPRAGTPVVGVRTLREIVHVFSHRLQLQERITGQIADALEQIMDPHTIVVVSRASHMCMVARGAQSHSSTTLSSVMRGDRPSDLLPRAVSYLEDASYFGRN